MGDDVTVVINGIATGLVEACAQAAAALADLQAQASEAGAASEESAGMFGGLGGMLGQFGGVVDEATSRLGFLGDGFAQLGSMAQGWMSIATSMFTVMAGFAIFNDVANAIEGMTQAMFDLNNTMEKTSTGWGYILGKMQMVKGTLTDVSGVSQDLVKWTGTESMQLPFTRQDLISGISALTTIPGMNADKVKGFIPTLADIASTYGASAYGGRGVTLQQAAYAVMEATFGRTRMLKFDLHVNPEDLAKYGLVGKQTSMGFHITDPESILPALQKWAQAKGLKGAAAEMSTQTFFGAWSSFIDRIQNFEIAAGHSVFERIKGALVGISAWIDAHQGQINQLADGLGVTLAGAFNTVAGAAGNFFTGLQQSGMFAALGFGPAQGPAMTQGGGGKGGGRAGALDVADQLRSGGGANAPLTGAALVGQTVGQLAQGFGDLLQKATPAISAIEGFIGWVASHPDAIKATAAAVGGVLAGAFVALGIALFPIMAPLVAISAAFGAAGVAASLAASHWAQISPALAPLGGAFQFVQGHAGGAAVALAVLFTPAAIQAGVAAAAAGVKIAVQFVGSLAKVAIEGWAAIPALASFVAQLVMVGAQAIAAGAKITAQFVASLAKAAAQAAVTGAAMIAALVPAAASATAGFITMAATGIASAIAAFVAYIPVAWSAAVATIAATWPVLAIIAAIALLAVGIYFAVTHWKQISQAVEDFAAKAGTFLAGVGANLLAWIKDLPDKIGKIKDQLATWAADLATKALTWGSDMIQGFINGIGNKLGDLKNAAGNVAKAISDHLHFSKPETGPLASADQWMPDMMKLLTSGIHAGIPQLAAAAKAAAQATALQLGPSGPLGTGGGSGYGGNSYSSASHVTYGAPAQLTINAATQAQVQQMIAAALRTQNAQGNRALRAPGGFRRFGWIGG